ncbi:MAG: OmpA/MotB family protein [Bacteriovoracaceae bacterium]
MGLGKLKPEHSLKDEEILKLRKKLKEYEDNEGGEPPEDDGEAWLMSYADLMTLIASFFILMMAFANYDPVGFKRKTKEIAKHFSGKALNQAESKLEQLVMQLQGHPDISETPKIGIVDDGIQIIFKSNHMFGAAEASLKGEAKETLDIMIDLIYQRNPDYRIMVEGHTSNKPPPAGTYRNNWELSSARAAHIIEQFQKYGFPRDSLVAIGYGASRPVAPNQDAKGRDIPENIDLNRRAVIKVLQPTKAKEKQKLGFGVYFSESELFPEQ